MSIGALDPNNLTSNDHKKHGTVYLPVDTLPKIFFDKKCNKGENTRLLRYYQAVQEWSRKYYSDHIIPEKHFSVELMGTQNKSYNKGSNIPVLHGSIVIDVPEELRSYTDMEIVTDSIPFGDIIVLSGSNDGLVFHKLKREYFPSKNNPNIQKGVHNIETMASFCKQRSLVFDGDKMMNYYKTTGSWDEYRYVPKDDNIGNIIEYQKKFD